MKEHLKLAGWLALFIVWFMFCIAWWLKFGSGPPP
jgi:hypothetical protein